MKTKTIFYYAGCPVFAEAERMIVKTVETDSQSESSLCVNGRSGSSKAESNGVKSVPAPVVGEYGYHINSGRRSRTLNKKSARRTTAGAVSEALTGSADRRKREFFCFYFFALKCFNKGSVNLIPAVSLYRERLTRADPGRVRLDKNSRRNPMPRRKFRHSQRFESTAERSFQEYILNTPAQLTTRSELLRLVRGGEDTYLELKVKLSNSEKIAQGIVALANTAGGTIIFGVNDQLRVEGVNNPEWVQEELARICREEIVPPLVPLIDVIAFDSGKRIVALDVHGKRPPYRTRDGRFYLRIGAEKREISREELSNWLDEIRPLSYENVPLTGITEDDFDDALLWSFADEFEIDSLGRNFYQTADFLKKDLLLAVGSGEEFFPTVAGVLLFGKNTRVPEIVPRSKVVLIRYSGENGSMQVVEKVELKGNLLTLYEESLRFINRYCDLEKDKPKKRAAGSSPVQARSTYHVYSIREGVANALIHRDLALRDITTRILIYDNSIEIINPRRTSGLVPPASRAIRYGVTQRLNPQIASIFTKREYGTNVPKGGLPMILRDSLEYSARRVEIYTSNDEFKLKIFGA